MLHATTIADTRSAVAQARAHGQRIGFVPTMGALHQGHAELIRQCGNHCGFLVASIFVNPTQFNDPNDLLKYPRTPEADHQLCAENGVHLILEPSEREVYPRGRDGTFVEVPQLSSLLEGAQRPGHFRGVATVVAKLFEIVRPDLAAFGQKDFQQLAIIRRMVQDLDMPIEILTVPTVREPDGLAMSSRNRRLEPADRRAALVLSLALRRAADAIAQGERSPARVRQVLRSTVESEARARLGYAEVVDAATLAEIDSLEPDRPAVALLAASFGEIRLIDNALLPV